MALMFPNPSRSYDATRRAVRFWGHNQSMETSFFVSAAALLQLAPGTPRREDALLAVFDSNRARICEAATRVYGHGRLGISYDLTPANF